MLSFRNNSSLNETYLKLLFPYLLNSDILYSGNSVNAVKTSILLAKYTMYTSNWTIYQRLSKYVFYGITSERVHKCINLLSPYWMLLSMRVWPYLRAAVANALLMVGSILGSYVFEYPSCCETSPNVSTKWRPAYNSRIHNKCHWQD